MEYFYKLLLALGISCGAISLLGGIFTKIAIHMTPNPKDSNLFLNAMKMAAFKQRGVGNKLNPANPPGRKHYRELKHSGFSLSGLTFICFLFGDSFLDPFLIPAYFLIGFGIYLWVAGAFGEHCVSLGDG